MVAGIAADLGVWGAGLRAVRDLVGLSLLGDTRLSVGLGLTGEFGLTGVGRRGDWAGWIY